MSDELKPCPWCCATPRVEKWGGWYQLCCDHVEGCMLFGHGKPVISQREDVEKLVERWNRRAHPAATGGRVEITDEMIEAVYANITPNDILTGETEPVRRALAAALAKAGVRVGK